MARGKFSTGTTQNDLIAKALKRPAQADTAWYGVTTIEYGPGFTNSWANAGGSGNSTAEWWLSESGEVRFRGKISGGSAGTVAFVLPREIRPEYSETFIVATDTGSARVVIRQNGEVYIADMT